MIIILIQNQSNHRFRCHRSIFPIFFNQKDICRQLENGIPLSPGCHACAPSFSSFLATCNKIKLLNEFGHERTIFKMNLVYNGLSINYKWNSYHKVKSTGKRITVNNITLIM